MYVYQLDCLSCRAVCLGIRSFFGFGYRSIIFDSQLLSADIYIFTNALWRALTLSGMLIMNYNIRNSWLRLIWMFLSQCFIFHVGNFNLESVQIIIISTPDRHTLLSLYTVVSYLKFTCFSKNFFKSFWFLFFFLWSKKLCLI